MKTTFIFLTAALLFLNATSLNSRTYQLSAQSDSNPLVRLGIPAGIDPADILPPNWRSTLDQKTIAELDVMTAGLQKYAADHNISPPLPMTVTFDDLLKGKYIKEVPPAPPGKKFAISHTYIVVVVLPQ